MTYITQQNTTALAGKKILAISGSLRTDSSNTRILQSFAPLMPNGISYYIYDGLGNLPHYNPVLDTPDAPESVKRFRHLLKEAAAVIICSPEYAFGIPGSLKNALDWTVSSGEFVNKPVALIVAASVGENAYASLLLTLSALSANILDDGKLLIPFIKSKMDANGHVIDEKTDEQLQLLCKKLVSSLNHAF